MWDMHKSSLGFSLLELMIAVTVVAILSMIAYPSYREHIAKSHRVEAQSALMEISQFMEKNYTAAGTYTLPVSGSGSTLPFTTVPKNTITPSYTIALSGGNGTTTGFTVIATRTGSMSGDRCGDFTLNQSGSRGLVNADSGITFEQCR